jgi:hypothetical protein
MSHFISRFDLRQLFDVESALVIASLFLYDVVMKKSPPRHFSYKHPVFTSTNVKTGKSPYENSVYYWWWRFLKENKEYTDTCINSGVGVCAELYKDFGDVRGDDFKQWWLENDRGANLFAEPVNESKIRVLKPGDEIPPSIEALTISLPLELPKDHLIKRVRELLAEVHKGAKGKQYAKASKAKYKIIGQPEPKKLALYYEAWIIRNNNPSLTFWEIGNAMNGVNNGFKAISAKNNSASLIGKKKRLTGIVSRYLKRAEELIKATGQGRFV